MEFYLVVGKLLYKNKMLNLFGIFFFFFQIGILGSLFSFLQFTSSPVLGGISDVYGRKPVMILCLVSKLLFILFTH